MLPLKNPERVSLNFGEICIPTTSNCQISRYIEKFIQKYNSEIYSIYSIYSEIIIFVEHL